jgi:uncharacterized Zn finger protein
MTGPNLNIDVTGAADIVCKGCGNYTFVNVYVMKKISAIMSPTGKEGVAPIPTFACNACGFINPEFLPIMKKEEEPIEGEAEYATDVSAEAAIERQRRKIL